MQTDYPRDRCIHHCFEAQVQRTPRATALVYEGQKLTYEELNCRANQLAHYLRAMGVGPETAVALCVERSLEMMVSVLGILKAGGAYVPLDPLYPQERLAFMLKDTQAPVLLTQQRLVEQLPACNAKVVCLDTAGSAISRESKENPTTNAQPQNMAYVIFTSGSTGKPKGVVVQHRSVLNLLAALHQAIYVRQHKAQLRISLNGPLAFDTSVKQFIQLLNGHTLYILPAEIRFDGNALLAYLQRHELDVFDCTPSQLKLLIGAGLFRQPPPWAGQVLVAGEAIDRATWQAMARATGMTFYNLYGPTECTVDATAGQVQDADGMPTIGRPLANMQSYILNQRLRPVPIGEPGELYVGGAGLARGYLNRPHLTAENFIPNPFSTEPGARLYRTGDLARYLPDGCIQFLGRVDRQIKIRGFRIELEEIETVLVEHPAVREAIVTAPDAGRASDAGPPGGDRQLIAYYMPACEPPPTPDELRRFLSKKLPTYMIPTTFVMLEVFPLTPHGKIDRHALPAPAGPRLQREPGYAAPRTALERFLAPMWQDVLGMANIDRHDNFFEIGGDSIKGMILINSIQQQLQKVIHVVALFDAPTIAQFAAYLDKHYPQAVTRALGFETSQESAAPGKRIGTAQVAQFRQLIPRLSPSGQQTAAAVAAPTAQNPRAIFIFCPPRSGSTLLRVMLGGHPQLFAPPELNLLSYNTLAEREAALTGHYSFRLEGTLRAIMQIRACSVEQAQRIMLDHQDRHLSIPQFYRAMQTWLGDRILVDKSTPYALDSETLKRAEIYFEAPLYVHLLRHPCGVIHSFERMRLDQLFFRYEHPFSRRELAELVWLVSHQNILAFLDRVPHPCQHRVRFEDLVTHPRRTIESLCRFLDLDFCPEMLQPQRKKKQRMTDGLYPMSRMIGDPGFHEHDGIEAQVADRWKREYTTDFLGDLTWQVAESLGYEHPQADDSPGSITQVHPSADRLLAQLDQLSDEEVDALLRDRLASREENGR